MKTSSSVQPNEASRASQSTNAQANEELHDALHNKESNAELSAELHEEEVKPESRSSEQQPSGATKGRETRKAKAKYAATSPEELQQRFYDFGDLSSYSWKDRFRIRLADLGFYWMIRCIGATLRWETRGSEHLDAIYANGRRAIFTFWHTCIFSGTWFWRQRGIIVMSSQSKDGEFTSRLIKRFGYGTVRGSSTRGAGRALAEMTACLEQGIDVAFTIDGPKGPAFVAKPGAVTLARHSGQAIFPFHIAVKRYLELPSWDRLQIPLPFTRAITLMAEPIYVARDASSEEIEAKQQTLQAALDNLRAEGEAWQQGLR